MEAILNGESRQVTRIKQNAGTGVTIIWCPFCDRSSQTVLLVAPCGGCSASFREEEVATEEAEGESSEEAEAPSTRSRRRST